jgi:hypothetical protein
MTGDNTLAIVGEFGFISLSLPSVTEIKVFNKGSFLSGYLIPNA